MDRATAIRTLFAEEHVSASQINTFRRCPRAYRYRYVERVPPESRGSALAFGSAIHAALEHFYKTLKNGEREPTAYELGAVFHDAWCSELRGDVPILFGEKEDEDSLLDLGTRMLAVFHEKVERPHRVIEVEMPFSIELAPGLPRLVGVLDLVVLDEDGSFRIVEHKTGARRWTDDKLLYDQQITAYTMTAPYVGLDQAAVTINLLTKTKKPDLVVYEPTRTQADIDEFVETATAVLRAVDAGAFWPNRDWMCKGCEYAARCVAG